MDRFLRHRQPQEKNVERKHHEFHLRSASEGTIAHAQLEYFGTPFPFFYISGVASFIERKGNATELLKGLNDFLKERGKAGLLVSHIGKLYERCGWERVPGHADWWAYNLPSGIADAHISRAIRRVNEHEA